jgi:hypothetical protein
MAPSELPFMNAPSISASAGLSPNDPRAIAAASPPHTASMTKTRAVGEDWPYRMAASVAMRPVSLATTCQSAARCGAFRVAFRKRPILRESASAGIGS